MHINQIDLGIGYSARQVMSPNKPTPSSSFQEYGIHEAIVVDDIDEQMMGRVWVYVPGHSSYNSNVQIARYTPTRQPMNSDGTPGAMIPGTRTGFIMVSPLQSHSGSDRPREAANQPDGRNPQIGQSNSYGQSVQHRNGDMVAICFAGGNPSRAYVLGSIPKPFENDMIPGHKPAQTNSSGSGTITPVGPGYQKGGDNKDTLPSTVLFNNLTDAGLIQDPIRGLGSSSCTRESPSRVWGYKSLGDPDNNYMGHQLIMDDHPDSHLTRLRTSKGSQILLSDTGDFILLNTSTGKVWLEIDDTGNINVYAHSSISFHAEQDINFVADRDFNMHVGGNINWIIKGDSRIRMAGGANLTVGETSGDLDITTINNTNLKIQGNWLTNVTGTLTMKSAKEFDLQTTGDNSNFNIQVSNNFNLEVSSQLNILSQKTTELQSKDGFQIKSTNDIDLLSTSGQIQMQASSLLSLNSNTLNITTSSATSTVPIPLGSSVPSISISDISSLPSWPDANQADIPTQFSVTGPPTTSGPPATPGGLILSGSPIVPQHHPWNGVRGNNPGYDAAINPSSIPNLV